MRAGLLGAQSIAPVTRTPRVMSERNYKDFLIALVDNNGVRESSEYQSLDPAPSGRAGHGHQRNDFFFEQIESRIDSMLELCAKPGTFFFVPRCGLGGFVRRRFVDAQRAHQERFMRARIRRRNSLRSTSFAVPASISESLRMISASHAFSTSESGGPSRLTTRLYASSARSASERFSASERTFSSAVPLIGVLNLQSVPTARRIAHLGSACTQARAGKAGRQLVMAKDRDEQAQASQACPGRALRRQG